MKNKIKRLYEWYMNQPENKLRIFWICCAIVTLIFMIIWLDKSGFLEKLKMIWEMIK